MTDSDDDADPHLQVLTPEEMLQHGMKLIGWNERQLRRKSKKRWRKWCILFAADFGAKPHVVCQIWEDLQTTALKEAYLHPNQRNLDQFLYALHFLKAYPTEKQRQNKWHVCDRLLRDSGWFFVERIAALKELKIVWLNTGNDIWCGSVDGTHIKSWEPTHDKYPKDPSAFSWKHHSAGFNCEVVLSLKESKIIWLNGPFEAGTNDISMFTAQGGLCEKLREAEKMVIADNGYRGYDDVISRPNSIDSPEVAKFKNRARCRHEAVNGMIKHYKCTDSAAFQHGIDKFALCFDAAAVITQYRMELGEPLFEV
ncbi:hypothetical protein SEMRO_1617_G286340.1 [Seminavis robusta]|uniref:DDE Tnp4 domain-containing protein n=1 Tax=Seminavis robusta TaxID=568900 RepID=A0A9N8ERC1_9STRA|nr:hypothetical protein SEMRO_1617_G286340.1 [Seminavis robusta]|eukprot:Sro1617_g286340.1 n/a (311) ;mRNA; f:19322-20254